MRRTVVVLAVLLLLALTNVVSVQAQTPTEGERIAKLEGTYEHLATKADIADVRTEVVALRSELHAGLATMRWFIGVTIAVVGLGLGFAQYKLSQKINEALSKRPP